MTERAEVQAYRRVLAERDEAKARYELARRAGADTLTGSLSHVEELELAYWRAQVVLDDAAHDLDETDPALIKIRRFLDRAAKAYVDATAPQAEPVLASLDDLDAHANALVAHADAVEARRKADTRWTAALRTAHAAVALVAAERKAARLPVPVVRGLGSDASTWLAPREPFVSSATGRVTRLERLRRDRTWTPGEDPDEGGDGYRGTRVPQSRASRTRSERAFREGVPIDVHRSPRVAGMP